MAEQFEEKQVGDLTIRIDRHTCIGSGNCTKVAPEVFELDDTTIVTFREDMEEVDRDTLLEACEVCPVEALVAYDKDGKQIIPET